VPGREKQAIGLFDESMRCPQEKVSRKVLTYFEPLFFTTSDLEEELGFFFTTSDLEEELGFFILKGPAPEVFELMEDEKYPGS